MAWPAMTSVPNRKHTQTNDAKIAHAGSSRERTGGGNKGHGGTATWASKPYRFEVEETFLAASAPVLGCQTGHEHGEEGNAKLCAQLGLNLAPDHACAEAFRASVLHLSRACWADRRGLGVQVPDLRGQASGRGREHRLAAHIGRKAGTAAGGFGSAECGRPHPEKIDAFVSKRSGRGHPTEEDLLKLPVVLCAILLCVLLLHPFLVFSVAVPPVTLPPEGAVVVPIGLLPPRTAAARKRRLGRAVAVVPTGGVPDKERAGATRGSTLCEGLQQR